MILITAAPVMAQKAGGTLRLFHRDSPASASIHEEATISTVMPFMSVFNNLVMFDPKTNQNRPDTIVPDLADFVSSLVTVHPALLSVLRSAP